MRYLNHWLQSRSSAYEDPEKPLYEHLGELRTRLFYSILAIVACSILGFVYAREIIGFMMVPLKRAIVGLDIPPQLHFTSITEPFFQSFQIALFTGIALAFPFWIWQLWLFVAPGLYRHEKRMAAPLITSATLLFILGATFAYTLAVPLAYRFLLIYANPHQETALDKPKHSQPMLQIRELPPRGAHPGSLSPVVPSQQPVSAHNKLAPTSQKNATTKPTTAPRALPSQKTPVIIAAPTKPHILIQEPSTPTDHRGLQIQIKLDSSLQKDPKQPLSTPEQWLTALLHQKHLVVEWRTGPQQRQFQIQWNWPQRPVADSAVGELKPILTLQAYLSLSSWFLLGFGLIFQTPLAIFLVVISGMITAEELGRYRRHAFVIILVIAAVLTPTGDPVNLMIMAIPMYILFELGLWVARIYLRSQPSPGNDPELT